MCCVGILSNLTCNNVRNKEDVRHAIPTLVKLLGPDSHYPLIKAAIGLCRNLGLSVSNQQLLRQAGAIPNLVELLWRAQAHMERGNTAEHEEIFPVDIAEGCIGALHVLARDPVNRTAIKESNVIATICTFLSLTSSQPSLTNENMQRSAGT